MAGEASHVPRDGTAHDASGWHALFTFESTHDAMAALTILRRIRVDPEEVPSPGEVEANCGLAVRIPLDRLYDAIGALATEEAAWNAIYELGERQEVIARLG